MSLYENTLIGTFLYGLGIEVGVRTPERALVSGVDLLQQTPLDTSIGDLIVKAPRYVRVMEFKRLSNRDNKEVQKIADVRAHLDRHADATRLHQTSAAIHRYILIDDTPTPDGFVRYALSHRPYLGGPATACSIRTLSTQTAQAMYAPSPSPTPEECARYLAVLKTCRSAPKTPSGGGSTLLVALREGVVEHAHVTDITDLFRTHRQLRALQHGYDLILERIRQAQSVRSTREPSAGREREAGDDLER